MKSQFDLHKEDFSDFMWQRICFCWNYNPNETDRIWLSQSSRITATTMSSKQGPIQCKEY
jgi:hypothetical protein